MNSSCSSDVEGREVGLEVGYLVAENVVGPLDGLRVCEGAKVGRAEGKRDAASNAYRLLMPTSAPNDPAGQAYFTPLLQ